MKGELMVTPEREGDIIPVQKVSGSPAVSSHTGCHNLLGNIGLNGNDSKSDVHDNDGAGRSMWLSGSKENYGDALPWIIFDFGATYPLGEMWVWNYNQHHPSYPGMWKRGMKHITLTYSLDGRKWTECKGDGYPYRLACADGTASLAATNLDDGEASPIQWNNVYARYVKITAAGGKNVGNWGGYEGNESYFGLSAVRFYAGSGLVVEPEAEWTNLFLRKKGWTGSDGIYSIPFNGNESPGAGRTTQTVFLFGDTFIGDVDGATDHRLQATMINNTVAVLEGDEPNPESISFHWDASEKDVPKGLIIPNTPKALSVQDSYYWLQDGVSINGMFYCFPSIIAPDPEGDEGFKFAMHGITRVSVPIDKHRGLMFDRQTQVDTDLHFIAANGKNTYFGAAIMANTEEAGMPNPDGYVYIYGLQNHDVVRPVVARVPAEHFEDFERWSYWDGSEWSFDRKEVVPIAEETSPEFSVSPMRSGALRGKYILAYEHGGIKGNLICVAVGDTPVGPFNSGIPIHYCSEPEEGKDIYTYNAKGHPHLSGADELLISYNVNTTSEKMHARHASIYRPRFIRLRQIE